MSQDEATERADREEIVTDPDPDTQLVLAEMLRDGRAAWERAIRQRDEARVTIEHVRALLSKWGADRETYPPTDEGRYAEVAVKLCQRELRDALGIWHD